MLVEDTITKNKISAHANPYTFICGADAFLVNREGQKTYNNLTQDALDDFSIETINSTVQVIAVVETTIKNFSVSFQSLPLLGGTKTVWLKAVNSLADSPIGRS